MRGQDRWPKIAAMMTVDHLDFFPPNQTGGARYEFQLGRIISYVNEWHARVVDDFGKSAAVRTGKPDLLAKLMEGYCQFDALVIRPATGEQGV
jgi:hypothetical protein